MSAPMTAVDVTYEGTRREVATSRGVLRYHEAGSGPPLLLLHGSGIGVSGWRNFRGNLAVFARHFHCHILEFPGFGVSDPAGASPVLDAGAAVLRFMDALGIESAAVIGNSMGGIVGANVAMARPERIDRLITIGAGGPSLLGSSPSEGVRLLRDFADAPSRDKLERWLECMVHDPRIVTAELLEERWATAADPESRRTLRAMYGSAAAAAQQDSIDASGAPPYWAGFHKVRCPTLLTWGLDDRQCPPDMSLLPLRTIPHAELHVFPNCGHWVMVEAKAAFERVALEFLLR